MRGFLSRGESARVRKLERALEKARREAFKDETVHTVALEYRDNAILLDAASKLARKRKNAARKEPFTVEWIESLPAGDVLYDIGANVGPYALIAARRPQGPLRVVAFEPGYASFATLCTNIVINGAGGDVTPLPVTLGARTELGQFRYSDVSPGAALHNADGDAAYDQPVLVHRLDDLVETFALPAPDHLKIDVDGAERAVVEGAERLLGRVSSVLVELSHRDDEAVEEMLVAAGLARAETYRGEEAAFWYALYRRGG